MNIEELAVEEQRLLWQVQSVTGLIEEKHQQLEQLGTYQDYRKVYEAYSKLLDNYNEGLEALKRAVFLNWYSFSEPPCFSGLSDLSEQATLIILEKLERTIESDSIDLELKWMLPFYNSVNDLPFSLYKQFHHTRSFLQTANTELWRRELNPNVMGLRGQMGEYWLLIETEMTSSDKIHKN